MEQGAVGDCYLIAALGAMADSSPAAIENMIIPNGVENGIAELDGPLLLPERRRGLRGRLRDGERDVAGLLQREPCLMPGRARTAVGGCR